MLRKFTIYFGDNNLHNVYAITVIVPESTSTEQLMSVIHESYSNTPVIKITSELLMNVGYVVSEVFIGKCG